jgi:photosynthetic reaction center cytochrome c subunit
MCRRRDLAGPDRRNSQVRWIVPLAFGGLVLIAGIVFLSQAERPPVGGIQRGYRGTSAVYIYNPRTMAGLIDANQVPATLPYAGDVGPKASAIYKNVQVLGDVNAGEFTRLMVSMTNWLAPVQGCAACHNTANFSDDTPYTKVVARRMLQMVRHINSDWTAHVAATGVTCYTCHRGQLVPVNIWFNNPGPIQAAGFAQMPAGKNHPNPAAGGAALPLDPFTPFLEETNEVRIQSTTALRDEDHQSIKQAEWTYALMINISEALGVNCNYCHMTRALGDWTQSSPQRVTAWYGIRMVRDLNRTYLDPLKSVFPPNRLGPAFADSPKVTCATCHNGVYKPLFGVSMAQGFPELK